MSNIYRNIIFTNHALKRMKKRAINKKVVWQTINYPDQTLKKNACNKKFSKIINSRKYQIIAKKIINENQYLVISTWVRGENDKQNIIIILISLPFKIIKWAIEQLLKK